jgi:4-hydroxybenzoate polyprenyltransferase
VDAPPVVPLLRACHPLPALAVTVFGTALGVAAGAGGGTAVLLAAAVGTGQLSIGWLNDLRDADLDSAAGRSSKPVAAGEISRSTVRTALAVAAGLCVVLSLALGWVPGLLHLLLVAAGWSYDLWLKGTLASPLPYLVAFGVLPAVAATAAGTTASWPLLLAAGVLGVAAHFANTVPDAVADAVGGVRGLPQRLGPRGSQAVAAAGVVLACALLLLAGDGLSTAATALLVVAAAVGGLSPLAPPRLAFRLTLLAAGIAVVGVVAAG